MSIREYPPLRGRLLFLMRFAVGRCGHTAVFLETLGKIALRGKTGGLGHFRNTVIRVQQQFFTCLNAHLAQILYG